MAGETLPPVVAVLQGDISDLVAKVAAAAQEVESLDDVHGTATADLNFAPLDAGLATVTGQLDLFEHSFGQMQLELGLDFAKFEAELAAVEAMAHVAPIEIPVEINMAPAVAEFAAGAAAMKATAIAFGGGAGGGGLLALLGWGGGAFGFAAFGSVLSLAGLGFEHLATLALGLAGSLAGALTGGAILAAGALSRLAVGMGSDILVANAARQAVAALVQGIEASPSSAPAIQALAALSAGTLTLQQATLLYGKAAAQAQYQTAQLTIQTKLYWLQAISPALIQLATLRDSLLGLANTYIPLIAWAAQKNFALINAGLKPLLAWLQGPQGLGIFKNLEEMFATTLPSAMMAFTNGVELVIKILNYAAGFTGQFIAQLALWLQKMNNAPPSTWEKWVNTLIGMFRTWWALMKQVGITLYDIFGQSVGLGTTLVATITQMLVKLDAWLTSTSGKNAVHNLFQVHLQEILAILGVLPPLLAAFGQLYLTVAPTLTLIATGLADIVGWMLRIPGVGTIAAWALALAILWNTMKIATIASWVATFIQGIFSVGAALLGLSSIEGVAAAASFALGVAIDFAMGPIGLIIAALAALGVAVYLVVTHWQQLVNAFNGLPGPIKIVLAVLLPFISIPVLIITHWQLIVNFFKALPGNLLNAIKALPGLMLRFFEAIPGAIWNFLTSTLPRWIAAGAGIVGGLLKGLVQALPTILKFFIELPFIIIGVMGYIAVFLVSKGIAAIGGFVTGLWHALPSVIAWFIALPGNILRTFATVAVWLFNVGINLILGFVHGIGSAAPTVWNWFRALPGVILSLLTAIPGLLLNMGKFLITGFWNGMIFIWNTVTTWIRQIPGVIANIFSSAGSWLINAGKAVLNGFWNGLKQIWNDITGWISSLGNWITSHKGPIETDAVMLYPHGVAIMQGLHNGLKAGIPPILATLTNLSAQMGAAVSGRGALSLSGNASANILHSISGSIASPLSPLSSVGGGGNVSPQYNVTVNMPAGATTSQASMVAVVQQALAQHDNDLRRSMGMTPRVGALR